MAVRWRRVVIFVLSLLPFIWITQAVVRIQSGEWNLLGPEPAKAIVWFTGSWAFNFLLISLAVSPLSRIAGQRWLMRHRRMLGLFAFFYVSLHLLSYFMFLLQWRWHELWQETIERPYLLAGMLAWLMLIPLAVTSTQGWQRRLGRRWRKLHSLVYIVALLAALHYLMQIRSSWFEPGLYALLTGVLLVLRWRNKLISKKVLKSG
ncbi:MAG: sulfoxide reductase heme-binding subunit YedZ [Oceanospirillaceae bacterium]|nr:sulfoxide reductase heme-binding subunit YedZ [Oceanospirillaceae bacterium]MBT14209.1 sulfoxide reductase heme-binding subunit YedZ [Oceanospirillaceae bacterium]|tara:strand:+ start:19653 stop:20267 length:615 start_codon:yes stop_codon:yes gene_type:complete